MLKFAQRKNVKLNCVVVKAPKTKKLVGIWNLNPNPGTHWTCWKIVGDVAYVFDPLSAPPDGPLERYLYRYVKSIKYNDSKVQADWSERCGEGCIWWLYQLQKMDYSQAIRLTTKTYDKNELILLKWINN